MADFGMPDGSCIRDVAFGKERAGQWPDGCESKNGGHLIEGRVDLPSGAKFVLKLRNLDRVLMSRTFLFDITLPGDDDGMLLEVKLLVDGRYRSCNVLTLGDPSPQYWSFEDSKGHSFELPEEESGWGHRRLLRLILDADQKTVALLRGEVAPKYSVGVDQIQSIGEGSRIRIVLINHSKVETISVHRVGLWSSTWTGASTAPVITYVETAGGRPKVATEIEQLAASEGGEPGVHLEDAFPTAPLLSSAHTNAPLTGSAVVFDADRDDEDRGCRLRPNKRVAVYFETLPGFTEATPYWSFGDPWTPIMPSEWGSSPIPSDSSTLAFPTSLAVEPDKIGEGGLRVCPEIFVYDKESNLPTGQVCDSPRRRLAVRLTVTSCTHHREAKNAFAAKAAKHSGYCEQRIEVSMAPAIGTGVLDRVLVYEPKGVDRTGTGGFSGNFEEKPVLLSLMDVNISTGFKSPVVKIEYMGGPASYAHAWAVCLHKMWLEAKKSSMRRLRHDYFWENSHVVPEFGSPAVGRFEETFFGVWELDWSTPKIVVDVSIRRFFALTVGGRKRVSWSNWIPE